MAIFAELRFSETSTNTGLEAGNRAPALTLSPAPFTEIRADFGLAGGDPDPGGWVTPPPLGPVAPVAPVAPPEFAGPDPVEVLPEPALQSPPWPVAQSSLSCCANGSLLRKRLNASSWPDCGEIAVPGSVRPSAEVAAGVPADAVAPPTGVAAGVVGAGAACEADAVALDGCRSLSVRGSWKASRPRRITPPTAAIIFWRLAFA